MRIPQSLLLLSGLGVWAQIESPSPEPVEPQEPTCDPSCYSSYRALLGDLSELIHWVHSTTSHFTTANYLCATPSCSACPFCHVPPPTTYDLSVLAALNHENRRIASSGNKTLTCTPCLNYVDKCRQKTDPYIDETPAARVLPCGQRYIDYNWPSCNPPGRTPNHVAGLTCELELCTNGPLQCRVGGQCERRICKDLVARNATGTAAAVVPVCKDCFKPWLECVHDTCFGATNDCLGSSCLGIDIEACTAQCWSATPLYCQRGGVCEHAEYLDAATPFDMSAEDMRLVGLARECNRFRDECLGTCNQKELQVGCNKACHEKYPDGKKKEGEKLYNCREVCKERTCTVECQDRTCCAGPEQCRLGGDAFRCDWMPDLSCRKKERKWFSARKS